MGHQKTSRRVRSAKKGGYVSLKLNRDEANDVNKFQRRLEKHIGFRPTLSQVIRWLVHNGERMMTQLEAQEELPKPD